MKQQYEEYASLSEQKRLLEASLKSVNGKMQLLGPVVAELLLNDSAKSVVVNDVLIYMQTHLWVHAKPEAKEEVIKALYESGLTACLTINRDELTSFVRKHRKEGTPLPSHIEPLLTITESADLRTKKTSKGKDNDATNE